MDKNDIEELRKLVEPVMYAPTKKDAKVPLRRLEFMAYWEKLQRSIMPEILKHFSNFVNSTKSLKPDLAEAWFGKGTTLSGLCRKEKAIVAI